MVILKSTHKLGLYEEISKIIPFFFTLSMCIRVVILLQLCMLPGGDILCIRVVILLQLCMPLGGDMF